MPWNITLPVRGGRRINLEMKIFGLAGYSGSGKTTLLEALIPTLREHGTRVSVIKHSHHALEVDQPGKDSWRHRKAGATEVLLCSAARWILMHENHDCNEPSLEELIRHLSNCDLILVEGYKMASIPKLEVHRVSDGSPWLYCTDDNIAAIVADVTPETNLPVFAFSDRNGIARFILKHARDAAEFQERNEMKGQQR